MIGLADVVRKHREALTYDLLKIGHTLDDIGSTLSWGAFNSFVRNADATSALIRDAQPDLAEWSSTAKTNAILADIFDVLAMINANLIAVGSGKKAKEPKLYPRPSDKTRDDNKHIGSAMPTADLKVWIEKKRKARR